MTYPRSWRWFAPLAAGVLFLAGCGGPDDGATDASATPTTTTTTKATTATTTTTIESATTADDGIRLDEGVVFHTDEEGEWTASVFYPTGEGPWPLIVAITTSATLDYIGEPLAERGAVIVVADSWTTQGWLAPGVWFEGEMDRVACLMSWAQAHASDYNADPEATTVTGYSGGAVPAAWIGLGLADDSGCEHSIETLPIGLVAGENQFLFHHQRWDPSFETDDLRPTATLDALFNADRWTVSPDLQAALWSAEIPQYETRTINNPPGDDSWIWLRDNATPVFDDLAMLGAFSDEQIDYSDNAMLMEQRMKKAGVNVQNHTYDIGHEYTDEVYDLIMSIQP